MIKITECPRDAMQGINQFIPTELKIKYINQLLKVGFDTIDFGSFVSPKAIPQMADTKKVIESLDVKNTQSKLLAIIANKRGAEEASQFEQIKYLGFPFSISEIFQKRNTNSSIKESIQRVKKIQHLCEKRNKILLIYISMAFGNPYGEEWNPELVIKWTKELAGMGIRSIALSDTIGVSNPKNISYLFKNLIPEFPDVEIGAHLHTTPDKWEDKVEAAFNSGCNKFDGAFKGYGGCPMAKDDLTGNMPTEKMIAYFQGKGIDLKLNEVELAKAMQINNEVFLS